MSRRTVYSAAAALLLAVSGVFAAPKTIAITIDDVPFLSKSPVTIDAVIDANQRMLSALREHGVQAVGFVNEDKLLVKGEVDRRIDVLEAWLKAGMELGNHNFGHVGLWQDTLERNQDAVIKGEVITRWLSQKAGKPLRYYRHPYTQTGRDDAQMQAFEAFLGSRDYEVAPFTIEHDDYLYSCVYERAKGEDKAAMRRAIVQDYLAHLHTSVRTFEAMSEQLFGRQIPQILLIHATELNVDSLGQTLSALRGMGYSFITLEQALADSAYRSNARASKQFGPSWLARWAWASGTKLSHYGQPDPTDASAQLAAQLCGH
jgi:peptidoglycan/xylan/chitin deacetylase (PgdA/CDA1 family)